MIGITRRGFVGTLFAIPAATVVAGAMSSDGDSAYSRLDRTAEVDACRTITEVEIPVNVGVHKPVTLTRLACSILKVVEAHCRHELRATRSVGLPDARFGDTWGSGTFTRQPFAIVHGLQRSKADGYVFDRLMIEDVGRRLHAQIREHQLLYFGQLVLPHGGVMESVNVRSPKLSLRAVTIYDICNDEVLLRVDLLGGPA